MFKKQKVALSFTLLIIFTIAHAQNYENTQEKNLNHQNFKKNQNFGERQHRPYQGMMQDPMIMRNPKMMQLQQQIMLDLQEVRANRDRLNQSMMRLQQHRMEMMQLRQQLMQQKQQNMQMKPMMHQRPGKQNEFMRNQQYKQKMHEMNTQPTNHNKSINSSGSESH